MPTPCTCDTFSSPAQAVLTLDGSNASGAALHLVSVGVRDYALLTTASGNNEGAGKLILYDASTTPTWTQRLTIDVSGNVGLGPAATSPAMALDIRSTARDVLNVRSDGPDGAALHLNCSVNSGRDYALLSSSTGNNEGAGKLILYDASTTPTWTPRLTVDVAGNLGVATTAPQYQADIFGAAGWLVKIGQADPNGTNLRVSPNAVGAFANNAPAPLLLNPSGGNVGIGTTSPGYPLDVAGTIRTGTGLIAGGAILLPIAGVAGLMDSSGTRRVADENGCYYAN